MGETPVRGCDCVGGYYVMCLSVRATGSLPVPCFLILGRDGVVWLGVIPLPWMLREDSVTGDPYSDMAA